MQSTFPPMNSLEIERAKFAYMGQNEANVNTGADLVVGAGRLGTVLPLALASGVTANQAVSSPSLLTTVSYPVTSYTSGSITYWPDEVVLYLSISSGTTVTISTSPDNTNFYTNTTWSPSAAGSNVFNLGRTAAVQFSCSAAVEVTAQVQVTN